MNAAAQFGRVMLADEIAAAEHCDIALQATYQIDATLAMLARENGRPEFDLVVQAVLPRLLDLTAVVMAALSDDGATAGQMQYVVDRCAAKAVRP
jgi:hypothetical protein